MTKFTKTIKGISAIIRNPWLLNKVLSDESVWQRYVVKKHNLPNGFPVLDINDLSDNFSETLNYFAFLDGSSLPTDIALLKSVCRKFENCSYFEIGTWRGESVSNVADVAAECYTLNLAKPDILNLGYSETYADLHGYFSKGKENITHLTGDSLKFDFEGLNKKFDVLFIDGNHHYDFVKNDTEKIFKHLLHDDSIVVWHDYAFTPERQRPEVMAGILDGVPAQFRKNLYHVSNTMCAIFIRGDFKTTKFSAPVIPDKVFKLTIENSKFTQK